MTAVGALDAFQTLMWEPDVFVPKLDVVVRGPRTGLLRRIEKREETCRTVLRSDTLRHSFIAEGVLHPSAEARQGRTKVRREAGESLDEPPPPAALPPTTECPPRFHPS